MNEALRLTALFVRDLLTYNEQLIRVGRQNYEIEDFEIPYIGVDALGAAQRLASGQKYDGTAEEMTYQQQWQAPVTLSFYGPDAWITATQFGLLIQSQKALELQESLGLGVYQVSTITDVKILAGVTYGERQDITLNVRFAISVDVDILRIDTAELEVRHEIIPFLSEENVMASSIDNLINVAFRKGQDLSGFGLKVGGKGDYRPPQFDAESLKFEYIDANESYGIDLNGSRFLQKLTFAESQDFTRATTGTFIGSNGQIQTAAINAPRFTHDPVTREVQGLLIEEARTNLVLYSDQFENSVWSKAAVTVTENEENAPNGTATADKIFEKTDNAQHFLEQSGLPTSAGFYTQSIFLKAGTIEDCALSVVHLGEIVGTSTVNVNLSLGTISGATHLIISTSIEELSNEWFRASITYELTGAATSVRMRVFAGLSSVRVGNTANFIYIWGAQAEEEGGGPTSYIPTTSAQVIRAADICVRVLGDEFNPESFTAIFSANILRLSNLGDLTQDIRLFSLNDGVTNRFSVFVNDSSKKLTGFIKVNGSSIVNVTLNSALSENGIYGLRVNGLEISLVFNGEIVVNTVAIVPVVTELTIGSGHNFTNSVNGPLKDFKIYPKSLSDAELIALTGGA